MQSERDEARSSLPTKNERTTTLSSRGLSARLTRSTWFGIKRRAAGTSCRYRGKTIYRFATFLGIQIESLIIDSWSYPSYPSCQDVRPLDHVCPCVCACDRPASQPDEGHDRLLGRRSHQVRGQRGKFWIQWMYSSTRRHRRDLTSLLFFHSNMAVRQHSVEEAVWKCVFWAKTSRVEMFVCVYAPLVSPSFCVSVAAVCFAMGRRQRHVLEWKNLRFYFPHARTPQQRLSIVSNAGA
ncbi:uncharacterized protein K489DRAFT_258447 [Dissoconium aciculare CBS 342.82]|uniref:Uncharacterized protein n=1 Tax=Dissoconium aciculare CBS 342.82 TaxID=1314786 RepID=A0A6J3M4P0_9PEZI|nr:uncharacterized protein K489DRAFT_258447 [Dissoconium aciculare CBS 342.82]KAF1821872.1 hypothetical protein K489DRAFT_258447 [Dissoconium aciculare CBS 342.82]